MTTEREEKEKDREKERQRDRGREKEREKEREKAKLRERDRDSEKKDRGGKDVEKERERAAAKDKERGSKDVVEKERAPEKERERERERERAKDQERDRKKDREKERKREHSKKDKDREKEKETEGERERERVKEREREREKAAEREKDREKDREKISEREADSSREKERKREGRQKERDREGREKDREREVREKDSERERERDNEREEKEHQKSRARDKELDIKERERDQDNRHKDLGERETGQEHHQSEKGETREKRRGDDIKDRPSKEPHGSRPSASDLEDRITKMREERHRASAEQRSSAKKADADNDIHAWVNKSRKIEQKKKLDERQKAARMAKILAEQDNEEDDDSGDEFNTSGYGGRDLAGLKVRHGFDKVMEGHAVVLTLKDTSVLDGDDVNLAVDELENIEMAEQKAREDAYKAAKKKPGSYEDKFGNDMDALVTRTILPQYDDAVKEEGVVLDANGGLNEESRKRLEEVRLRLEGSAAKQSLSGAFVKPVSDYFTEEDMLQFKKPKKKKKLRKKDKLDLDELEAEAVAAGLGAGDLGSRNSEGRRAQKLAEEKAESEARKKAYQNALNKAEDASNALLRDENLSEPMEVDKAESPVHVGDDDEDFYKSLDRAREAALKNQRSSGNPGGGAQSVAARLVALQQEAVSSSQTPAGVKAQEGGLVFTDTGEFCRSLQLDDAIIRRAGPKDVFGEEDEEAPAEEVVKDTSMVEGGWTEIVEVDQKQSVDEDETDAGDQTEEPITEVSVGKGLAGALSLLQERGSLKETVDWGGRNMDKKRSKLVGIVDESNNQVGQRDILLDRVDEFGRTMTPKEAFRKLSHKFHGKGPGKMKQEKKMKQFQEELRLKQMNSGDTPLMSMEKMREAQARMHTPYIVISGHIKPGQTSDPRSGFGTVEKEPIGSLTPMLGDKSAGSLTPMLGDKKVEHFLGIKRKSDSGFKEPPAKQPKVEH